MSMNYFLRVMEIPTCCKLGSQNR